MMYGCENRPMRKENEENLVRAERRMICMMCGVTLVNREKSEERLGLMEDIGVGVKKARLRWFGHVFRRDLNAGVKRAFLFKVDGKVGRGRPRRTWYEVVRRDTRDLSICERDALDRTKWRNAIRNIPANPRSREKRQKNV